MEEAGVAVDLYFNHFWGLNTRGGANTNGAQEHSYSIDLFVRTDFEQMGLVPGGSALMQVKTNKGKNVNPHVGALSDPIDDADFDKTIYIDQLYWEQSLFEKKARFRQPVVPGDQLRIEVSVERRRNTIWRMTGKTYVQDTLVTDAVLQAMITD